MSWAEIDPEFGADPVLSATTVDGAATTATGARLVVPQDRCGRGRYVDSVTRIRIGPHPDSRTEPHPGRTPPSSAHIGISSSRPLSGE
ncbi:hypothetical protein [Streptomyces sp. SID3343]|uniref:hypothetical protein n=1 Tax=Streptomyces sp. SID3343 TaxID=2690260 RepID=UPI00136F1D8B|nr:hypothetical protein [Streptomyces sp. SID3343]MYW04616.1 hypothetical protein [Streptomyces sp. SID3343]